MTTSTNLAGKVAIVTGGGRGIGKAIAYRLAEAGANVVIASRKLDVLEATAKEFAPLSGKTVPIVCHVGRVDDLANLVQQTEEQLGAVDVLVNNSATNIGQGNSLDLTDEMFFKMFEINVLSAMRLVNRIAPRMIERGTGGSIINLVSIAGLRPQFEGLLYSATKAALIMMTRNWAVELGKHNIRVNSIAPGLIQTDFSEFFWKNEERMKYLTQNQPLPRIGVPEEVGGLALYLASADSSYVTGQTFVVDGGALTR